MSNQIHSIKEFEQIMREIKNNPGQYEKYEYKVDNLVKEGFPIKICTKEDLNTVLNLAQDLQD